MSKGVRGGDYVEQTGIRTWEDAQARGIFQDIGKLKERIAKGEKVISLSLSFCVAAILRGDIREEDVEKIITGAKAASTQEGMKTVIEEYKKYYWRDKPDEGEAIAWRFFNAGKIEQAPAGVEHDIAWGYWQIIDKPKDSQ